MWALGRLEQKKLPAPGCRSPLHPSYSQLGSGYPTARQTGSGVRVLRLRLWSQSPKFNLTAGPWAGGLALSFDFLCYEITPWSPGLCCFSAVALGASPHGWDSGPSGRDPWGNLGVGFCSSFSAFLLPGLLFCRSQPPGSPSALSPAPSSCQDPGACVAPTPTWKEAARWPGHPRPPDRGPRSRAATVQCLRTVA